MKVTRVAETPRVTKPYTPKQWQDILQRGQAVDLSLREHDVRLTMGGEPTFVAASDFEAAEWNIDAMGPTKRKYAGRLIRRLTPLWAPGAALTYNMGKHYPGEQLPRWSIHAHWREDGEAVWRDPELLASDDDHDDAAAEHAAAFVGALAERLQVDPSLVNPAYEDIHYYLWREHRLPANVIAEDAKLRDELERKRLAKVFSQGLAAPVGSVLPLRRVIQDGSRRWQSGKWFFRDSHMFLVPGDSPIGLRLPLESLPWADPEHMEIDAEIDPFAPREKLPARPDFRRLRNVVPPSGIEGFRPVPQDAPVVGREQPGLVRTALTVESRDGVLHVFYPPLYAVEDWLELTAAVEDTAQEFGPQGHPGRLSPAGRPPACSISQSPPIPACSKSTSIRPKAGRKPSSAPPSSTRSPATSAWPPKNSCWTAAMSAPAAATTSSWAAKRPPTRRSCGGRIC